MEMFELGNGLEIKIQNNLLINATIDFIAYVLNNVARLREVNLGTSLVLAA